MGFELMTILMTMMIKVDAIFSVRGIRKTAGFFPECIANFCIKKNDTSVFIR